MSPRISVSLFRPTVVRKKHGKKVKSKCKIWHMAWRDPWTKKRMSKSTGTTNRQSANQFASKFQDKHYRQQIGAYDPSEDYVDIPFQTVYKTFLTEKAKRNRTKTAEAYRYSIEAFERIAKPKELRQVDRRMIHAFITDRLDEVKPVTVNRDLRQLRVLMNWCRQQSYISVAPNFKGLFLPVDQDEPILIPPKDIEAVMAALADESLSTRKRSREWWKMFIRIALFTGMRRSELLGLRWSEVDFNTAKVHVVSSTSKGRKGRTYDNATFLIEALKGWFNSQLERPESTEFVLPYERDPRGLYKDWYAILDHAGIPLERRFTPHNCRSTCVSEMLAEGTAITSVRDWVGHSSVSVTETHYASTTTDRRRVASERKVV